MTSCRATAKETAIFAKIWYPRYHALSRKKSKFPRYVLHEMQRKTSCYSKYFAQYFVIPATFRVMSRKSVQCTLTVQYHSQLTCNRFGSNRRKLVAFSLSMRRECFYFLLLLAWLLVSIRFSTTFVGKEPAPGLENSGAGADRTLLSTMYTNLLSIIALY